MRVCSSCGSVNGDENVFCQSCGTTLGDGKTTCPSCGTKHAEGAQFCHRCGSPLAARERRRDLPLWETRPPAGKPLGLVVVAIYTALWALLYGIFGILGMIALSPSSAVWAVFG
jgi:uncharacterized membrane protein YvbJ